MTDSVNYCDSARQPLRTLRLLETSNLKPSTINGYARLYRGYIADALGPIRLRDLRRAHVKKFLNAKHEQISATNDTKTLSKNTVRLIRATLSVMLADALDDELVKSNVGAIPSRRRGRRAPFPRRALESNPAVFR